MTTTEPATSTEGTAKRLRAALEGAKSAMDAEADMLGTRLSAATDCLDHAWRACKSASDQAIRYFGGLPSAILQYNAARTGIVFQTIAKSGAGETAALGGKLTVTILATGFLGVHHTIWKQGELKKAVDLPHVDPSDFKTWTWANVIAAFLEDIAATSV